MLLCGKSVSIYKIGVFKLQMLLCDDIHYINECFAAKRLVYCGGGVVAA